MEGHLVGAGLSAPDSAAVSVHRDSGGLRLPVAGGADRRSRDALDRAQRQGLHSAAVGLCLRGSGHHGHAHHREPARPAGDDPGYALHDLLGAVAGLHAADCRLHPQHRLPARPSGAAHADDAGALPGRLCGRDDHRMAAEELDPQVQRDAVHSGAAAVPHAHAAFAGAPPGRPRAHLPAPGRHHHPLRHAGAVGAGPPAGDSGSGGGHFSA